MPRDVLVVGREEYGRQRRLQFGGGAADYVLGMTMREWAAQVDSRADGRESSVTGSYRRQVRGQRIMHIEVSAPHTSITDSTEVHRLVLDNTAAAYAQAARWAAGGTLGILLGHGHSGVVPLAPGEHLTVGGWMLQNVWRIENGDFPRAQHSRVGRTVIELGNMLWHHDRRGRRIRPRVSGVRLLSCDVGVGARGQATLDWLHQLWGVPVAGLVSRFEINLDVRSWEYSARVLRPSTVRTGRTVDVYDQRYLDAPPTDSRLFRVSSGQRPALDPAAPPPGP